jgi:hypothetical protein
MKSERGDAAGNMYLERFQKKQISKGVNGRQKKIFFLLLVPGSLFLAANRTVLIHDNNSSKFPYNCGTNGFHSPVANNSYDLATIPLDS